MIHDAPNASGQGGFGAVWGSKRLKAISVVGTGSIHVHDPRGLLQARMWLQQNYHFRLDDLKTTDISLSVGAPPVSAVLWTEKKPVPGNPVYPNREEGQRPQACAVCHSGCRARYESGIGNEAGCIASCFYGGAEQEVQFRE